MTEETTHDPDGALSADSEAARVAASEEYRQDDDLEREWPWVDALPECDQRMFAEEMSQLFAEAAETDDLAPVEQALREWRVTSETYSDPELAQLFASPRTANGERVPRPVV